MPAAPELGNRFGQIWIIKVFHKVKSKHSSQADSHVRIPGKVKINLQSVKANSGSREGKEVVQLYISDKKSSVERPVKELKGFRKVSLKPGETAEIKFEIGLDALSYFDADKHAWVCEPGEFEALIGASSADIRSKVKFKVK